MKSIVFKLPQVFFCGHLCSASLSLRDILPLSSKLPFTGSLDVKLYNQPSLHPSLIASQSFFIFITQRPPQSIPAATMYSTVHKSSPFGTTSLPQLISSSSLFQVFQKRAVDWMRFLAEATYGNAPFCVRSHSSLCAPIRLRGAANSPPFWDFQSPLGKALSNWISF